MTAKKKKSARAEKKRASRPVKRRKTQPAKKHATGSARPRRAAALKQPRPASPRTETAAQDALPDPAAFAQSIPLQKGHYALRHLGFAPGQRVQGGLPHGLVEPLTGDVTVHAARSGDPVPTLRAPNDTVMINVGPAGGLIAVICLNHHGSEGPGFRFILTPIALPELAAPKSSAPRPQHRALPTRVPVLPQAAPPATPGIVGIGHSELLGDVKYGRDEWIGGVGNVSLRLEGFTLGLEGLPPSVTLEYGVVDERGKVTWARAGTLAGSRGRAQPLMGVAARLIGPGAVGWSIHYKCRFVGKPLPRDGADGEICTAGESAAYLTAVHFTVEPRAASGNRDATGAERGVDGAAPSAPSSHSARILAHIEREGDREFQLGEWIGTPGSGRSIEGLQLLGALSEGVLEIGLATPPHAKFQWTALSQFCGSRGRKVPLGGVAFRLAGNPPGHRVIAQVKFVNDPTMYANQTAAEIAQHAGRQKLEAVRLAIEDSP